MAFRAKKWINTAFLETIENPGLERMLAQLQKQLTITFTKLEAKSADEANTMTADMQDEFQKMAHAENHRLQRITHNFHRKYRDDEAPRWEYITKIKTSEKLAVIQPDNPALLADKSADNFKQGAHMRLEYLLSMMELSYEAHESGVTDVDAIDDVALKRRASQPNAKHTGLDIKKETMYIDRLLRRAQWTMSDFTMMMISLENRFNAATRPDELQGVDNSKFLLNLNPEHYTIHPFADVRNCALKMGPAKTQERCLTKIEKYPGSQKHTLRPVSRYILDAVRATFIFEDPYALALFYEWIHHARGFTVVRTKNRLLEERVNSKNYGHILVNIQFNDYAGDPLIGEMILYLNDFYHIREASNRYVEITRASNLKELVSAPFFADGGGRKRGSRVHLRPSLAEAAPKSAVVEPSENKNKKRTIVCTLL